METQVQLPIARQTSRAELEEMMQRWIVAHDRATAARDWKSTLGGFYAENAEYHWDLGPNETFVVRGRKDIVDIGLGYQMEGFEDWSYPYERVIIDEVKGEVVGFWRQISPYKRPDGSFYQVPGLGCSHFRYAGEYKWSFQQDFLDLASVISTITELAAAGHLPQALKKKMQQRARGQLMPGLSLRPDRPSFGNKLKGQLTLARVALLGS